MAQPRSPEDIYADFAQRRSGLLQALTDGQFVAPCFCCTCFLLVFCIESLYPYKYPCGLADAEDFFDQCDPNSENLVAYVSMTCATGID